MWISSLTQIGFKCQHRREGLSCGRFREEPVRGFGVVRPMPMPSGLKCPKKFSQIEGISEIRILEQKFPLVGQPLKSGEGNSGVCCIQRVLEKFCCIPDSMCFVCAYQSFPRRTGEGCICRERAAPELNCFLIGGLSWGRCGLWGLESSLFSPEGEFYSWSQVLMVQGWDIIK